MTWVGHGPVPPEPGPGPGPGRTGPGEQVTPSSVVAMVVRRLDQAVIPAALTPEMWDAAGYGASLLLGALGALTPEEYP